MSTTRGAEHDIAALDRPPWAQLEQGVGGEMLFSSNAAAAAGAGTEAAARRVAGSLLQIVEEQLRPTLASNEDREILQESCLAIRELISSGTNAGSSPASAVRLMSSQGPSNARTEPRQASRAREAELEAAKRKKTLLPTALFKGAVAKTKAMVPASGQLSALNMIDSLRKTATENDKEAERANRQGIIHPTSHGKLAWDGLICWFVIYIMCTVPLEVGFHLEDNALLGIGLLGELCFMADVYICFRTAYFDHEELVLVTDRRKIAEQYLKTWFAFDVVASIPFDFIILISGSAIDGAGASAFFKTLRMARFAKVFRLLRMRAHMSHSTKSRRPMVKPHHRRLVSLLATFFVMVHALVCLFQGVGRENGWAVVDNDSAPLSRRYSRAMLWVLQGMLGEINTGADIPFTELPHSFTVFANFTITLGIVVQAIVIGGISSLFANLDRLKADQEAHLDCVLQVMQERNVPYELQRVVCGYFTFMWETGQTANHKSLFLDLPMEVQMQLSVAFKHHLIQHCRLFSSVESSSMLALVSCLSSRIGIPETFIYVAGERGTELFFVSKGECVMDYHQSDESTSRGGGDDDDDDDDDRESSEGGAGLQYTLSQGAVFGERVLLGQPFRQDSVQAKTFVELEVLTKSGFDRLCREHADMGLALEYLERNLNLPLDEKEGFTRVYVTDDFTMGKFKAALKAASANVVAAAKKDRAGQEPSEQDHGYSSVPTKKAASSPAASAKAKLKRSVRTIIMANRFKKKKPEDTDDSAAAGAAAHELEPKLKPLNPPLLPPLAGERTRSSQVPTSDSFSDTDEDEEYGGGHRNGSDWGATAASPAAVRAAAKADPLKPEPLAAALNNGGQGSAEPTSNGWAPDGAPQPAYVSGAESFDRSSHRSGKSPAGTAHMRFAEPGDQSGGQARFVC